MTPQPSGRFGPKQFTVADDFQPFVRCCRRLIGSGPAWCGTILFNRSFFVGVACRLKSHIIIVEIKDRPSDAGGIIKRHDKGMTVVVRKITWPGPTTVAGLAATQKPRASKTSLAC